MIDLLVLQNMKVHENRRQLFSSNASKESTNPFVRQRPLASRPAASQPAPLPWANGASSSSSLLVLTTFAKIQLTSFLLKPR